MADRGKTIICSVLFLDIAEYSRKSVSGQISLKERFNAYLSVAIRDVPIDDRIILDTGDGAALSFLGDVGDALQVALSMRESLREGLHMEPPLLVRMGINLGPVRLIRDINGQPNIVGDGINVAQRVMGFADPGQILVSRTYYDSVSRVSPDYAGMFHYQGSRTDKHVREHEIYAIGYPGEFTSTLTLTGEGGKKKEETTGLWSSVLTVMSSAPLQVKIGVGVAGLLLLAGLVALLARHPSRQAAPAAPEAVVPASAVVAPAPHVAKTPKAGKPAKPEHGKARKKTSRPKPRVRRQSSGISLSAGQGALVISCPKGATIYVDAQAKGTFGGRPMVLKLDAGRHLVLVMQSSRMLYNHSLEISSGKTMRIGKRACH